MFEKILLRFKGLAASSHINNNSSSTFLMSLFIQYIQEPKEFIIHACVALVFWKVFIQHCNHNSNDENNLNLSTYFHFNQNTYWEISFRHIYILFIYLFLSQKHDMYMKIFQTESSQIIIITASIVVAISYFTLHILHSYEQARRINYVRWKSKLTIFKM